MSLDSVNWIREVLLMGRHISSGNDINLVNFADRLCFQFDVKNLKRAEFSNGSIADSFNRVHIYTGKLWIPSGFCEVENGGLVLMQWHGQGADKPSAPLIFRLEGSIQGNGEAQTLVVELNEPEKQTVLYRCQPVYDLWLDVRFEIKWGHFVKVYFGDTLVADHGVFEAGRLPPYWKFGAYRTRTQDNPFPRVTCYWCQAERKTI